MKYIAAVFTIVVTIMMQSVAQYKTVVEIVASDAVHYLVIDPLGRRSGCDPRGNPEQKVLQEIPESNYGFESVGDIPIQGQMPSPDVMHVFVHKPDTILTSEHTVKVFGRRNGKYSISMIIEYTEASLSTIRKFENVGIIEQGTVHTYRYSFGSQPEKPAKFARIVTVNSTRQDITAAHILGLLGDKKLFDDWNKELDKFERDLSRKDSAKARQELDKFGKEVDKLRKETIKHEDKKIPKPSKFITQDAYQVIREDIDILLNQLPKK